MNGKKSWRRTKDYTCFMLLFRMITPHRPIGMKNIKLFFCGLESCTDESNPDDVDTDDWNRILEWDGFKNGWMREDNCVIRRYTIFAFCLYKRLYDVSRAELDKKFTNIKKSNPLDEKELKQLYEIIGVDELYEIIQKMLYMNLLKWVNNTGKFSFDDERKKLLHKFLCDPEHQKHTLVSIAYSDANIFIIAGQDGIDNSFKYKEGERFNKTEKKGNEKKSNIGICDLYDMFNAEDTKENRKQLGYPTEEAFDLKWKGMIKYSKTLFVSLYHPSDRNKNKFTLEYIFDTIDKIKENLR